jgi:hypothetical protein
METKMSISINVLDGASSVTPADRSRAKAAAIKALSAFEWRKGEPMQINPAEAYAAYQRHMSDEDYNRSSRETILIAAWEAAEKAADLALTDVWHNPDGAHCSISA